jgi:hypothetical protein
MFRKKKNREHPLADKAANKIAAAIITVQTKTSNAVNKQLNKLPVKRLKILLLLFCLSWGSLSIYFMVFDRKPKLRIDKIRTVRQPSENQIYKVDTEIIEQIHAYKKYMDSLGESIRPTLLDSMNVLEEIYLQQK